MSATFRNYEYCLPVDDLLDGEQGPSEILHDESSLTNPNRETMESAERTFSSPSTSGLQRAINTPSTSQLSGMLREDKHLPVSLIENNNNPSTSGAKGASASIPSPFKRAFYWPEEPTKKIEKRERLPSVVTSESWREYHHNKSRKKNEKLEAAKTRAEERKKKKEEAEEIKKKKLEEKLKKQKEKETKKPKATVRKSRKQRSLSSEEGEEWQPSGESDDEPQRKDSLELLEDEEQLQELSLEAEANNHNAITGNGVQPHNPVVIQHPQEDSSERLEEEYELSDSTMQAEGNPENEILSNEMIIENIFELEGLDIVHEDYADKNGENLDGEGKNRDEENEANNIVEDCGRKNLEGSFVVAKFQKNRGSFNLVCEVVTQDDTLLSVFTYSQVTRNAVNRFARNSRDTTAIRKDQILKVLPSPVKIGFGINLKYEFPVPPLLM